MMRRARTAPIIAPATAMEEVCLTGTSVKWQKLGFSNNFRVLEFMYPDFYNVQGLCDWSMSFNSKLRRTPDLTHCFWSILLTPFLLLRYLVTLALHLCFPQVMKRTAPVRYQQMNLFSKGKEYLMRKADRETDGNL